MGGKRRAKTFTGTTEKRRQRDNKKSMQKNRRLLRQGRLTGHQMIDSSRLGKKVVKRRKLE